MPIPRSAAPLKAGTCGATRPTSRLRANRGAKRSGIFSRPLRWRQARPSSSRIHRIHHMFMRIGAERSSPMSLTHLLSVFRAALATLLLLGAVPFAAAQANDQGQLAQTLEHGSTQQRGAALARVRATPVEARGADVLPALLQELSRQSVRLDARNAALRDGKPLASSEADGELLLDVLDLVTQHRNDQRIIPALLPFISTGNRVIDV